MTTPPPPPAPGGLLRPRRALLSVSDKAGLARFAHALVAHGVELISTGGTARHLRDAGLPVTDVSRVTAFPEVLGGRVKTLHPAIHAAILADRDNPDHLAQLAHHAIAPIDLVVVNLYPFEQAAAKPGVTLDELIEEIDIGGVALTRAAAKNHRHVALVTDPGDLAGLAAELSAHGGITAATRARLAVAAFRRTSAYDHAIASGLAAHPAPDATPIHSQRDEVPTDGLGETIAVDLARVMPLRYGENPHQPAAVYATPGGNSASVVPGAGASQLHGKELSYNNLLDASTAALCAIDLGKIHRDAHVAVIVKHTNPCGVGVGPTLAEATRAALAGDTVAAYGGIYATPRVLDVETAELLVRSTFFEVIVAQEFSDGARELLAERWKNVRLIQGNLELAVLTAGAGDRPVGLRSGLGSGLRSVLGGVLAQRPDLRVPEMGSAMLGWSHAAGPVPSAAVLGAAATVWVCAKHLTSNAIAIGGVDPDGPNGPGSGVTTVRLFGAGCGQQDRVWACRIASEKARETIARAHARGTPVVAASDAFFPFPDGPELLINAGVTVLIHPGGSKRDQETLDLCAARGVTCLTTGVRHFRH